MVVKLLKAEASTSTWFESSVISYGSQTSCLMNRRNTPFESSVISYGSQTKSLYYKQAARFESSVISYGSQTEFHDLA